MSKLTKAESALLRQLQDEPGWTLLIRLIADRVRDIQAVKIAGTNAFETLRMLHTNQGAAEELASFLDAVERGAFDN